VRATRWPVWTRWARGPAAGMAMSAAMARPSARTRAVALRAQPPSTGAADGSGPPAVLLLHGQPGSAADWDGVVERLGARAAAIAIDRPGWDGVHRAGDLEVNARAALAALDARSIAKAVIVGHSLGGAIAAWLAATRPERVTALVLAGPAANQAALYPVDRWLAAPLVGDLSSSVAMLGTGLVLTVPWLRRRVSAGTGIVESYLVGVGRAALRPGAWRAYASEQRTFIRDIPRLEERLGAITAPTTIIAGARDRIVPMRAASELSDQIPDARLVIADDAGHLLPQRRPQLLTDAILAALAPAPPPTVNRA
jgi:pimeloyl-ACP methyl ester carboxylesterase